MPLAQRVPKKRGFKSRSVKPQTVRLEKLNILKEGTIVTVEILKKSGIIRVNSAKIVSGGELTKKLTVKIPATKSAISSIEKAGSKYEA